jgi:hypothetical protein
MQEPNLNQKKTESIRIVCTEAQKSSWNQWIGPGEISRVVRNLLDLYVASAQRNYKGTPIKGDLKTLNEVIRRMTT